MLLGLTLGALLLVPSVGAISRQTFRYFTSQSADGWVKVNDNTWGDKVSYRVNFNPEGGKEVVVTGVRIKYKTPSSKLGDAKLMLRVLGDDEAQWAEYSYTTIPLDDDGGWYNVTFDLTGKLVVDDDPSVIFVGLEGSDTCLRIATTRSSTGHAQVNHGFGWQDYSQDLVVELDYELVGSDLTPGGSAVTGQLASTDHLDVYAVWLYAFRDYSFSTTTTPTGTFANLYLYDSGEQVLDSTTLVSQNVTANENKALYYSAATTGWHHLVVRSQAVDDLGDHVTRMTSYEPATPTITTYDNESSDGTVFLKWGSVPNADSYNVYRAYAPLEPDDFDGAVPLGSTTDTKYTDVVKYSGNYYYAVSAVNLTGESNLSDSVRSYASLYYLAEEFNSTWVTGYGENFDDSLLDAVFSPDGNYVYATGYTNQSFTEGYDVFVGKYSATTGALVESAWFDFGIGNEIGTCIEYSTVEDVLYVGGNKYSAGYTDSNYLVLKVDPADLSEVWHVVGGNSSSWDEVFGLGLDPDGVTLGVAMKSGGIGRFVMLDTSTSFTTNNFYRPDMVAGKDVMWNPKSSSMYFLGHSATTVLASRYDKDGELKKTFTFGQAGANYSAEAFTISEDGEDVYVVGSKQVGTSLTALVLKLDKSLNLYWSDEFQQGLFSDCEAVSGGVVVAGTLQGGPTNNLALVEYSLYQDVIFNTTWEGVDPDLVVSGLGVAVGGGDWVAVVGNALNLTDADSDGVLVGYLLPRPVNPYLQPVTPVDNHDGKASLSWESGSVNYWGASATSFWSNVYLNGEYYGQTRSSTMEITGLGNGTYEFTVRNENINGESVPSNPRTIKVTIWTPPTPTLLSASVAQNAPDLSATWTSSPGATTYELYASTSEITTIEGLTPVLTTNETSGVATLTEEGTYHVVVVAVNASGKSAPSNELQVEVAFIYFKEYTTNDVPGATPLATALSALLGTATVALALRRRVRVRGAGAG
ncbi:MAG: hypothetical protein Kow0069_12130 [Promethearchaeota archaeon]